jgi:hypothetical protein
MFVTYKKSDKISFIQERFLIEKSLNHTEKEIEKINKILDNKYHKFKTK